MPRGRPAGSVSYIGIKLSDLNRILNPETIVLVDRRYSILLNVNNCKAEEAGSIEEVATSNEKVSLTVVE